MADDKLGTDETTSIYYFKKLQDLGFSIDDDPLSLHTQEMKSMNDFDRWSNNQELCPKVGHGDVYIFLIENLGYTGQSLKSYNSLDAHVFYEKGWVHGLSYLTSNDGHTIVKAFINRSENDTCGEHYTAWVGFHNESQTIVNGHCTCMASQDPVCSHVFAVMFQVEAVNRLGYIEKTSCPVCTNQPNTAIYDKQGTKTMPSSWVVEQMDNSNVVVKVECSPDELMIGNTLNNSKIVVTEVTEQELSLLQGLKVEVNENLMLSSSEVAYHDPIKLVPSNEFDCSRCSLSFSSASALDMHKNLQHNGDTIQSTLEPMQHEGDIIQLSSEPAKEVTKNSVSSTVPVQTPARTSQRIRNRHGFRKSCPCCVVDANKNCGSFKDASSLRSHMDEFHNGDVGFRCSDCDKVYCTELGLKPHLKAHYSKKVLSKFKGTLFHCSKCGLCYIDEVDLKSHVKKAHKSTKHVCDACGKSFSTNVGLQSHRRRSHEEQVSFSCSECTLVFLAPQLLENHRRLKHSVVTSAKSKVTKTSNRLKRKSAVTSNERNNDESSCRATEEPPWGDENTCGRFKSQETLQSHMSKIHSGDIGFGCSKCKTMLFCSESDFKLHWQQAHSVRSSSSEDDAVFFKCDICGICFIKNDSLEKHIHKIHEERLVYKCDACDECFISNESLQIHKLIHDSVSNDSFRCSQCDRGFKLKRALLTHMKSHRKYLVTEDRKYQCVECGKKCKSLKYMYQHVRNHKVPPKCDICGEVLSTQTALAIHHRSHTGEKPFMCTVCGKMFAQSTHLRVHMGVHSESSERPYKCEMCGMSYHLQLSLTRHMKGHANGAKVGGRNVGRRRLNQSQLEGDIYDCGVCEKGPCQNPLLHIKDMSKVMLKDGKLYKCGICGKTFKQGQHLGAHIRLHTGEKPFRCEVCGKTFRLNRSLTFHSYTHSKVKPFLCTFCGRPFNSQASLIQHKRIHTGEKPYTCEVCSKSFRQRSVYVAHHRTHTGEKPYKCDLCSQSFIEKRCLLRHYTKHRSFNFDVAGDGNITVITVDIPAD